MTWLDLAALALVMWCASKGYLDGILISTLSLCGILSALAASGLIHKSIVIYLNLEWQLESKLAGILMRGVDFPLMAALTDGAQIPVPGLAAQVLLRMQQLEELPAVAGGGALAVMAAVMVRLFSLVLIFLLMAALAVFLLRIRRFGHGRLPGTEWSNLAGILPGTALGFVYAILACLALDALSYTGLLSFLQHDIQGSFLYALSLGLLNRFVLV